MTIMEEIGD